MVNEYTKRVEDEIEQNIRHTIIEEILRTHPELLLLPEIQEKLLSSQYGIRKIMIGILKEKG